MNILIKYEMMLPPSSSLLPCKLDKDVWRTFIIIFRWMLLGKRHFLNEPMSNFLSSRFRFLSFLGLIGAA